MKKVVYILFLLPTLLCAQQNLLLNREWGLSFENEKVNKLKNKCVADFNTVDLACFKPYVCPAQKINKYDSLRKATSVWKRKIKQENLFIVQDTADKF